MLRTPPTKITPDKETTKREYSCYSVESLGIEIKEVQECKKVKQKIHFKVKIKKKSKHTKIEKKKEIKKNEEKPLKIKFSKSLLPNSFSILLKKFSKLDQAIYTLHLKNKICFLEELNKIILLDSFRKIKEGDLEIISGIYPGAYEFEWEKNQKEKRVDLKVNINSCKTVASLKVKF